MVSGVDPTEQDHCIHRKKIQFSSETLNKELSSCVGLDGNRKATVVKVKDRSKSIDPTGFRATEQQSPHGQVRRMMLSLIITCGILLA